MSNTNPSLSLSFFDAAGKWQPERPADYSAACKVGRSYGDELLTAIADRDFPPLLGHVFEEVARGGEWSGVEIGFCQRIAEAANISEISARSQ